MKSVSSLSVFGLATLFAKDLEQTLAKTPKYTPWSLSAVMCGMDWSKMPCLGQGSCVTEEKMHQTAESEGGHLMSTEMHESENQMGASSPDTKSYRVLN